ncbi:MAG TPA: hypothetical protein VLI04_20970 [Nocardioidaceae bacterium]|nr:hypothetical protein [Nocardioidaceae bacterium]
MSIANLRQLAERAEGVEGRQADRLDELHGRIRTARRQRAAMSASTAGLVVIALVAGGAFLTRSTDETKDHNPVETPTRTPTGIELPTGQVTVEAEIGAGDIRGWNLVDSRTNAQAGFQGATDLNLVVETGELYSPQSHVKAFCQGDPDTWWVLTFDLDPGPGSTDGGLANGTRGMYGQCSPDDPATVPATTDNISQDRFSADPMAYPIRMFVTDAIPAAARPCISGGEDAEGCVVTHGLVPLENTEATFGFGVYEHKQAPRVLDVLDGASFEALAIADGVEYLVDRAVVAAPGADQLVVTLPASDQLRIIAVQQRETKPLERCAESIDIEVVDAKTSAAQMEEFQRRCVNELELRVDGVLPKRQHDWYLGEQQTLIPPGEEHVVTVDVIKNDPRNVRYAVIIWEARS